MKILGIETSCDETGAAIVEDGKKVIANVVASSLDLQKKYGGVVPEVAAREQVKVIIPVIKEVLFQAKTTFEKIDALAVTVGPGLVGSLLVGVETVKALGLIFKKPTIPVNHLYGHLYANWLTVDSSQFTEKKSTENRERKDNLPCFPLVALIVSGGHTDLVLMKSHKKIQWLGGTKDDAAGEAFDKVARILGLSYPGGPEIEKVAKRGDPKAFYFPRPLINSDDLDFSFSGLKTAVVNLVRSSQFSVHGNEFRADVAASFQQAVVDVLVEKTLKAAQKYKVETILLGGGVASNTLLRDTLQVTSNKLGVSVEYPPVEFCLDNGAAIAAAAFFHFKPKPIEKIQAQPGLHF